MNSKTIDLNSGKIKAVVYSKEDYTGNKRIKTLIMDLVDNVEDFSYDVLWIMKAIPKKSAKLSDLLKEAAATFTEKNTLIFSQAGILTDIVIIGDTEEGLKGISYEGEQLKAAGFDNIVFNRIMSRSYGNPNFYIFMNDISMAFINNNIGGAASTGKIINRIYGASV